MLESLEDDDSSSNESKVKQSMKNKRKRNTYKQKYNSNWETDELFKGWIKFSEKGEYFYYCKVCSEDYKTIGGKPDIKKHAKTKSHEDSAKRIREQKSIASVFSDATTLSSQVKEAEIKMAAFIVQQRYSFNSVGPLVRLFKDMFPNCTVAMNITCSRTKCTAIVRNVTGRHSLEQTIALLHSKKFSLLVDEATDVSGVKHLAMIVRLFDGTNVIDRFLALLPVSLVTADNLYEVTTNFFEQHKIPWKSNLIGFAADGASNMFGVNHSLAALLKRDVEHLFLQKCICHTWALCASEACKQLSHVAEDLVRDIHAYFKNSYKRTSKLHVIQEILNLKPHKLLKLCPTRWLALRQVVKRYLERWDAIVMFFRTETAKDSLLSATMIKERLELPHVKMNFEFLDAILPFFTELNLEMQSSKTKIHRLHEKVSTIYRSLLDCFLNRDYLRKTPLDKINFRNPDNFLPIEQVYLGGKLTIYIAQGNCGLDESSLRTFRVRCLSFYIEACAQIVKRFNLADETTKKIKELSIIDPVKVMTGETASIIPLAALFPNLVPQNQINTIDQEWRELRNFPFQADTPKEICEFWLMIHNLERGDGCQRFPIVSKFVMDLLSLPHSTATVERLFSQLKLTKTDLRNKLETETLTGIMHTKVLLNEKEAPELNITGSLIAKHNSTMYDSRQDHRDHPENVDLDLACFLLV